MQKDAGMRIGTITHVGAQPLADLQQNVLSGPTVRQAQGSRAGKSHKLQLSMLHDSVLEVQANFD